MRRIAIIFNDIVINIAIYDGHCLWQPNPQYDLIDITDLDIQPDIGWTYKNQTFIPPEEA